MFFVQGKRAQVAFPRLRVILVPELQSALAEPGFSILGIFAQPAFTQVLCLVEVIVE
ncbi:hypothetical protein D3C73_1506610 [compost metagenome]